MDFYIDAKGEGIDEFLADNGEYIGMLGSKTEENISPDDISIEKINGRLKADEFLLCLIMNGAWWVCVLFNNADGAQEVRSKYKGKIMLWYWLSRDRLKYCMHHMQYKEFLKEFPEPKRAEV